MEQVYLGFFSSLFNKIYKSILEPIIKFLTGILTQVFTWVFDNILKPLLIEIIIPIAKEIIDILLEILSDILYAIYVKMLQVIDTAQMLFNVFGGVEQIEYNGSKYNILELFFRMEEVQSALWVLVMMSFVLLIGCAIAATIRSMGDLDGQKPVMKVLHSTGQGFFRLISIPLMSFMLIILTGTILSSVYTAVTSASGGSKNNTTVARTLFVISTFNAANDEKYNMSTADSSTSVGVTDELRYKYYHTGEKSISYTETYTVERDFKLSKINYIVGFGAGIFLLYILVAGVFKFLNRLFNVLILVLCAPMFAATQPLDDGEKYKSWKDMFIGQLFSGFGGIIAMQVYLMVMPIVLNGDVKFGLSAEGEFVIRVLFLLGGAYAIKDAGGVITGLVNSTAASMESQQDMAFFGALKTTYNAGKSLKQMGEKIAASAAKSKKGSGASAPAGGGKSGEDQKFGGAKGGATGKESDAENKFSSSQKPSNSWANLASAGNFRKDANSGKILGGPLDNIGAGNGEGKPSADKLEPANGKEEDKEPGANGAKAFGEGAVNNPAAKNGAGKAAFSHNNAGAEAGNDGNNAGAQAGNDGNNGMKVSAVGGSASKGKGGAIINQDAPADMKPSAPGQDNPEQEQEEQEDQQQNANGKGGKKKKKPGIRKSFLGGIFTVGTDSKGKSRIGVNFGKYFQFGMQKDGSYKTNIFGISTAYGVNGKITNWEAFGVKARYDQEGKLDKVKVPFLRFKATTDENGNRVMKLSKVKIAKGYACKRAETVTKDENGNVLSRKLGSMYCSDCSAIGMKKRFDQQTGQVETLSLLGLHNKRVVDEKGNVSYVKDYRNFLGSQSVYDRDNKGNYHVVARKGFLSDKSYALNKETGERTLTKVTSFGGRNLYENDLGDYADNANVTRYDLTPEGVNIRRGSVVPKDDPNVNNGSNSNNTGNNTGNNIGNNTGNNIGNNTGNNTGNNISNNVSNNIGNKKNNKKT